MFALIRKSHKGNTDVLWREHFTFVNLVSSVFAGLYAREVKFTRQKRRFWSVASCNYAPELWADFRLKYRAQICGQHPTSRGTALSLAKCFPNESNIVLTVLFSSLFKASSLLNWSWNCGIYSGELLAAGEWATFGNSICFSWSIYLNSSRKCVTIHVGKFSPRDSV